MEADIYDHIAKDGKGCVSLSRGRGLIVGGTEPPPNISAGWGWAPTGTTADKLRELAKSIEQNERV